MGKPFSTEQRNLWKEKIQSQKKSGLSIQRWCQENNTALHLFHYWNKQLFPKVFEKSSFAELIDQKGCSIDIEYQEIRIHLEAATLRQIFQVLKEFKCSLFQGMPVFSFISIL